MSKLPWAWNLLRFRDKYRNSPQKNDEHFVDGMYGNCRALDNPTDTFYVPEPSGEEKDTKSYFRKKSTELLYSEKHKEQAKAKGLCATCPVQLSCLSHAYDNSVDNNGGDGVWGGKTASERKEIRSNLTNPTTLDPEAI